MTYDDPWTWFDAWWRDWLDQKAVAEPTRVCLATADEQGRPSARIVLLKQHDERGLVFFTNHKSRKGQEMLANPQAALCFDLFAVGRQIRARGPVGPIDAAESDAYWQSRARESQVGAHASHQSETLGARQDLVDRVAAIEAEYAGRDIPRPAHWGGFRLVPEEFEFWHNRDHRLHERCRFDRTADGWTQRLLNP